jgi:Plavaka transposase
MPNNWTPFENKIQFLVANLLYHHVEMSATNVDLLMELWGSSINGSSPFQSHQHLHATIDLSSLSDVPWKCFITSFSEDVTRDAPSWKWTDYEVWYCDPDEVVCTMLDNLDFNGQFDFCPYVKLDKDYKHCWSNIMSTNIDWYHCVSLYSLSMY